LRQKTPNAMGVVVRASWFAENRERDLTIMRLVATLA
jgi:hypothetical protein